MERGELVESHRLRAIAFRARDGASQRAGQITEGQDKITSLHVAGLLELDLGRVGKSTLTEIRPRSAWSEVGHDHYSIRGRLNYSGACAMVAVAPVTVGWWHVRCDRAGERLLFRVRTRSARADYRPRDVTRSLRSKPVRS
jgi:hypothetical protein